MFLAGCSACKNKTPNQLIRKTAVPMKAFSVKTHLRLSESSIRWIISINLRSFRDISYTTIWIVWLQLWISEGKIKLSAWGCDSTTLEEKRQSLLKAGIILNDLVRSKKALRIIIIITAFHRILTALMGRITTRGDY